MGCCIICLEGCNDSNRNSERTDVCTQETTYTAWFRVLVATYLCIGCREMNVTYTEFVKAVLKDQEQEHQGRERERTCTCMCMGQVKARQRPVTC